MGKFIKVVIIGVLIGAFLNIILCFYTLLTFSMAMSDFEDVTRRKSPDAESKLKTLDHVAGKASNELLQFNLQTYGLQLLFLGIFCACLIELGASALQKMRRKQNDV